MTKRDLLVTGGVALGTMLGALVLVGPSQVEATGAGAGPAVMSVHGVTIAVEVDGTKKTPEATLTVVNTNRAPYRLEGRLAMVDQRPSSPHARMVQMPMERWHKKCLFVLAPGEEKTVTFAAEALRPRSFGYFRFETEHKQLETARFSPDEPAQDNRVALVKLLGE